MSGKSGKSGKSNTRRKRSSCSPSAIRTIARSILDNFNAIFKSKGIICEITENPEHTNLSIQLFNSVNREPIARLQSGIVDSTVNPNRYFFRDVDHKFIQHRRVFEEEDVDCIKILWISTEPAYGRRGIGAAMVIYAICHLILNNPAIKYIILDDDSDKSHDARSKNMYTTLGFDYREETSFIDDMHRFLQTSGPEKQNTVSNFFSNYAERQAGITMSKLDASFETIASSGKKSRSKGGTKRKT
jgi:hypothetical protein